MKVVIQKVKNAQVDVEGSKHASIGKGFVLLVGFEDGDSQEDIEKAADKISKMRIFEDDEGKMNLNIQDAQGEILSISQFTLSADVRKGNRPSFTDAMAAEKADEYFNDFNHALKNRGLKVQTGVFQSHMNVHLNNDGPVTIILKVKDGRVEKT